MSLPNRYQTIVIILSLATSALLQAHLTKKEEKAIVSECELSHVIKQLDEKRLNGQATQEERAELKRLIKLRRSLNYFFRSKEVQELLASKKRFCVAHNIQRDLQRLESRFMTPDEKQAFLDDDQRRDTSWREEGRPLFEALLKEFNLENAAHGSQFATFTLRSQRWPGYVIKMPASAWLDGEKEYFPESEKEYLAASPYQNISRVFYNRKIRNFIAREQLDLIHVPKKYLYHLAHRPVDLCDDNYIVISEDVFGLASLSRNADDWRELASVCELNDKSFEPLIDAQYVDLITQLVQVIQACGLWDIKCYTVFLVSGEKVVITDSEKPGLGGGFDCNFFHKDDGEFERNGNSGIDGLYKLLT